jgi:hypothetical protein
MTLSRSLHWPMATLSNWMKMPSPRFSTVGTHVTHRARVARVTSVARVSPKSSSPSVSGPAASNRVKPTREDTSRNLWARTTFAMLPEPAPRENTSSERTAPEFHRRVTLSHPLCEGNGMRSVCRLKWRQIFTRLSTNPCNLPYPLVFPASV